MCRSNSSEVICGKVVANYPRGANVFFCTEIKAKLIDMIFHHNLLPDKIPPWEQIPPEFLDVANQECRIPATVDGFIKQAFYNYIGHCIREWTVQTGLAIDTYTGWSWADGELGAMLEHGAPAIEAWMQHTLNMKNWWELSYDPNVDANFSASSSGCIGRNTSLTLVPGRPELVCDRWATNDAGWINMPSVKNESGSSVRRAKVPISTPPCEGNRQQTVLMDNTGPFHNPWLGDAEESQSVNLSPIHLPPRKNPGLRADAMCFSMSLHQAATMGKASSFEAQTLLPQSGGPHHPPYLPSAVDLDLDLPTRQTHPGMEAAGPSLQDRNSGIVNYLSPTQAQKQKMQHDDSNQYDPGSATHSRIQATNTPRHLPLNVVGSLYSDVEPSRRRRSSMTLSPTASSPVPQQQQHHQESGQTPSWLRRQQESPRVSHLQLHPKHPDTYGSGDPPSTPTRNFSLSSESWSPVYKHRYNTRSSQGRIASQSDQPISPMTPKTSYHRAGGTDIATPTSSRRAFVTPPASPRLLRRRESCNTLPPSPSMSSPRQRTSPRKLYESAAELRKRAFDLETEAMCYDMIGVGLDEE